MIRFLILCISMLALCVSPSQAQEPVRVDPANSSISADWFGTTQITLALSQGVPYRVFTLAEPSRLVVDFKNVDWSGVTAEDLLNRETELQDIRFGNYTTGWSRLVADLDTPLLPKEIGLEVDPDTKAAVLRISLSEVSASEFRARSGVPKDAVWGQEPEAKPSAPVADDRFVVMLDPGHGGIDPGAEREGLSEKILMLDVAFLLRDVLRENADVDVFLTREADVFVSLETRVALAHQRGADLFLSLHADALSQGGAQGATVYTLSEEASDKATAQLAARHNRADIIAGADLTGSDDQVAGVLLDLARRETEPRSKALAEALVDGMSAAGGPMNRRPMRQAGFSVLKSADIPSVLVEVGFLSSARDLENIRNPEWRAKIVDGMARSVLAWRDADAVQRTLVRQ